MASSLSRWKEDQRQWGLIVKKLVAGGMPDAVAREQAKVQIAERRTNRRAGTNRGPKVLTSS